MHNGNLDFRLKQNKVIHILKVITTIKTNFFDFNYDKSYILYITVEFNYFMGIN